MVHPFNGFFGMRSCLGSKLPGSNTDYTQFSAAKCSDVSSKMSSSVDTNTTTIQWFHSNKDSGLSLDLQPSCLAVMPPLTPSESQLRYM